MFSDHHTKQPGRLLPKKKKQPGRPRASQAERIWSQSKACLPIWEPDRPVHCGAHYSSGFLRLLSVDCHRNWFGVSYFLFHGAFRKKFKPLECAQEIRHQQFHNKWKEIGREKERREVGLPSLACFQVELNVRASASHWFPVQWRTVKSRQNKRTTNTSWEDTCLLTQCFCLTLSCQACLFAKKCFIMQNTQ